MAPPRAHTAANTNCISTIFLSGGGAPRTCSAGMSPSRILHTVPAMFMGTKGTIVRKFRRQCSRDFSMYRSKSSTNRGRYSFASRDWIHDSTMGCHPMSSWLR